MSGDWLTYRELADRLGVSVEAARRRALRGKWRRQPSNKGVTLVMLPSDYAIERRPDSTPDVRPDASDARALIARLEGELAGMREALAEARARASAAEARASAGEESLASERQRADATISALTDLAERLDALAAIRTRPWWRRLVG